MYGVPYITILQRILYSTGLKFRRITFETTGKVHVKVLSFFRTILRDAVHSSEDHRHSCSFGSQNLLPLAIIVQEPDSWLSPL